MPKPILLVVDDDIVTTEMVKTILEAGGLEVQVAHGGPQALSVLKTVHPDLIVLDLMMPEMDGFTLFRILRGDPETADIPVVLASANVVERDRALIKASGVDEVLLKPFSTSDLKEAVHKLVSTRASG